MNYSHHERGGSGMITEETLKSVLVAQTTILGELRSHLLIIKTVLHDRDLVSREDYQSLYDQIREEATSQQSEIAELYRMLGLDPPGSELKSSA
jgi:hypothetical protein